MLSVLETKPHSDESRVAEMTEGPQRRLLKGYLHKTSNGLCGIKGYASLIAGAEMRDESSIRWAKKIIHEVERMEEIFRSVGDLNHTKGPREGTIDFRAVLADMLRIIGLRHPELEIETGFIPVGELLLPVADLSMILNEILSNAAQARDPEMETVRVRVSGSVVNRNRVSLTIEDEGVGIDRNLLGQVTDPFVTTRDGHLGIGLTRIDTLLDMYDLDWELTSEPGSGTTVTLEVGRFAGWMPERKLMKRKAGNG